VKGKRFESKNALCPFYCCEDPQRIMCEGVEDKTGLHVTFPTPLGKKDYTAKYCANRFESCRIYKMLEGKYANEDGQYQAGGEWRNV
jgi:hypothetical protein